MRVLLITSQSYSPPWTEGVSNIVRRVTQYLRANGDDVQLITSGHDQSGHEVGEFGEKIYRLAPPQNRSYRSRARFWLQSARQIRAVKRQHQPDVVLVFVSGSLFLGPRVLFLRTVLGLRPMLYVSGLGRPLAGVNWFVGGSKVLVGSPFLKRWFPQAAVAYPVTPTHLEGGEPPERSSRAREHFSLLYLGTAQPERGVEYLLRGVAAARQKSARPLQLVLALNGIGKENNQRIEQLMSELNLHDAVSIQGVVDINNAYSDADALVIPRQQPIRMSFPVRILEALSFNTPIIVTSICDMGTLVEGVGLEVNPTNPNDLARAIVQMANNDELYQGFVQQCPHLLDTYDSEKTLATIYGEMEAYVHGRN